MVRFSLTLKPPYPFDMIDTEVGFISLNILYGDSVCTRIGLVDGVVFH